MWVRGVAARSGRVGSFLAYGADRRCRGHAGERDLRPTRGWLAEPIHSVGSVWARGVGSAGSLGWLTGLGDGSMGASPRVMNSICVCVYILYIYLELGLVDNRSCVEPLIGPGGPLHTDRWTWTGPHPRTLTEVHDHQMSSDRTDTGPCSHTPSRNRHMPRYRTTSPRGPITLKPYDGSIQWSHRFYWR
jgi:hypothetical protein